jgi:hypothetical protein
MYRPDVRFFAPVTDDLQATVFEILVKIAASREDPEVLNGRALFRILNRAARLRGCLRTWQPALAPFHNV